MTLDPMSEFEAVQTENDYLTERLKIAEEKLRNALSSLVIAKAELSKLDGAFREERREMARLIEEFEEATRPSTSKGASK